MTCKTLRLFVKTLSAIEKYLVLNRDNLKIPIQAQLSRKEKNFSQFLAPFLKSRLNFNSFFLKKDVPHRFCISDITDFENVV